jgi:hypothetical protein
LNECKTLDGQSSWVSITFKRKLTDRLLRSCLDLNGKNVLLIILQSRPMISTALISCDSCIEVSELACGKVSFKEY